MRTLRSSMLFVALLSALSVVTASSVLAAPGDADTSFGGGDGIATLTSADGSLEGNAVVVHGGKVVVAGGITLTGGGGDIAIARFESDGDPDPTFGGGDGLVTTDFGHDESISNALAVLSNGKIVVAGYSYDSGTNSYALFVARYTHAGVLDPNFGGGDGYFLSSFGGTNPVAYDLLITPNGKIVVAGGFYDGNEGIGALWRFKANGKLDRKFGGGDGFVTFETGPGANEPWRIARRSDGKLVAAGWAETGLNDGDYDAMVARFNPNGTLDQTFGFGGIVQHNPTQGSSDYVIGMALYGNKILLAIPGVTNDGGNDVTLMRLNANGSRDRSWGSGDGEVNNDNGGFESPNDMVVDSSGRMIVVGASGSGPFIARFLVDGSPDPSFGSGGWVILGTGGGLGSVVVANNGKLVAAGNGTGGEMLAARFLP